MGEIAQYGSYFLPMNVFTASKEPNFIHNLLLLQLVLCPQMSPHTTSIVQIIFFIRSFEISTNIQKTFGDIF